MFPREIGEFTMALVPRNHRARGALTPHGKRANMQPAMERLKQDLGGAFRNVHAELDRIELLTAVLYGFSAPIPDYEPTFRHVSPAQLNQHELGGRARHDA